MTLTCTTATTRLPGDLQAHDLRVQRTEPSIGTVHVRHNRNFSVVVSAGVQDGHEVLYVLTGRLIGVRVSDLDVNGEYGYDTAKRIARQLRDDVRAEGGEERRRAHFLSLLERTA